MDERIKNLWLTELTIQNMPIGGNYLSSQNLDGQIEYDPLGVLCELYRRECGGEWIYHQGHPVSNKPAESGIQKVYAFRAVGDKEPEIWHEDYWFIPAKVEDWAKLDFEQQMDIGCMWDSEDCHINKLIEWIWQYV